MRSPLTTVVESLHLGTDRRDLLRGIPESAWPGLLHLTDGARLTLPLATRCAPMLPPGVRNRVEKNLRSNELRYAHALADWKEIADAMARRGVELVVLKGLTHWPFDSGNPVQRPQYDFDLYCPREFMPSARDAIVALGYEALPTPKGPETDHLPAMIRKTGFQWRGDYFDPALPLSVELHHRFWNPARESFAVRDHSRFWERRTIRMVGELAIPALDPVDRLTYATWHLARHLVRGNLRLFHVYEIACFLHDTSKHDSFWQEWEQVYSGADGLAEGVAFRLASEWFGGNIHEVARESIHRLPAKVDRWFRLFAFSPVVAMERLNKDELFLHLSLVEGRRERGRIAAQRVFPRNPPQVVLDAWSPATAKGTGVRHAAFRAKFLAQRAARHARALWPVARGAWRWWFGW